MINQSSGQLKSVVISNAQTGNLGIDITDLVTELEIYTSIDVPFKSGKLVITDGRGAIDRLRILGGEVIEVSISSSDINGNEKLINSSFIINSIDAVQRVEKNSVYLISLLSVYMYKNMYTRISEHFSGRTSDAIEKILVRIMNGFTAKNEEIARNKMLAIEQSKDNMSFIVPNKRLSEALIWIRDKSRSDTNTPYYLFELIDNSMAFISYGTLIKRPIVATYSKFDTLKTDPHSTYYEIKSLNIIKTPNIYNSVVSGMYASKTYAYDIITKSVKINNFNVYEHDDNLLNKNPFVNGLQVDNKDLSKIIDSNHRFVFSTDAYESDHDVTDTADNSMHVNIENYLPYLNSKRLQINEHKITCAVIGNINLYPGAIVNIKIPTSELPQKGAENLDVSLSGKYIVTNIRHQFTSLKHTTLFECAKDSWI